MSTKCPRSVLEMSEAELEKYQHEPETELSVLVFKAVERKEYGSLKTYLQRASEKSLSRIDERDSAGMTALHCAVASFSLPAVSLLLKYGASANAKDLLGFTPLFLATGRYPSNEIAKCLLEKGKATVDMKNSTAATPLHGAALQGNLECVKLLLDHGADPRMEDDNCTTAFDVAKNDQIRLLLHEAIAEKDTQKDISDVVCSNCKKPPKTGTLKRCGNCFCTLYCGQECQKQHWKQGGHKQKCPGYVLARPLQLHGEGVYQTSFYHRAGASHRNVKMFSRSPGQPSKNDFLKSKHFIVKVQLPLMGVGSDRQMMVYNADRSCEGFVFPSEKGYRPLAECVRKAGMKAYFWAKLVEDKNELVKIFHGKMAPYQNW